MLFHFCGSLVAETVVSQLECIGSVIVVLDTVIYIIDVISSLPVTPNPPGDYVPPGPGPTQIDPYGGPPGNYPLP